MRVTTLWTVGTLLVICTLGAIGGCNKNSATEPVKSPDSSATKTGSGPAKSTKQPFEPLALKLLPHDALGYIRITDMARVRNEFIRPTHVKDAARIRWQVKHLIEQAFLSFGRKGSSLGVKGETLLQLLFELEAVHVGTWNAEPADGKTGLLDGNAIAVLEFSSPAGLDALFKQLKPKLKDKAVSGVEVQLLTVAGGPTTALYRPKPKTVVLGTDRSLEAALRRSRTKGSKSLADSLRFQQAYRDWGTGGELFAYVNLQAARMAVPGLRFNTVTHLGASLRLEGGFSLRAYADKSKPFPKFLVRTSREKRFLSRIPADAVFLMSAVTDGSRQTRTNFVEWVMQELGRDDKSAKSLLPQSWRRFAESYTADPKKIEGQAITFVEDLWLAVLPVKSESAFFIAPNKAGRFGAAFLFDIEDHEQVKRLAGQLFEMGNRAKLPWKETTHAGLTFRYVDFAEVAKAAGRAIPPEIAKRFDLRVGYAIGRQLFYVGTLDAIEFAHRPAGKTIDRQLRYDNVDAKNAIMLSLRPGRILHRTFGVPQVDSVLKRLAAQIPKDTNYAVTLNFEPTQLTFKTNIPFVSLIAWLVTEWQGQEASGGVHPRRRNALPPG